ncbi:LpqB family beta-propeller domain-containing protein [Cellulomonas sp. SLBN-39]|uniref:LpqB family beta-propeller domain-containing protein n=1 Tax=Cellulomonas sp. SLBN-39 TaxID=2768446 RepID=UPI00114EBFCF|nr:LpqB family beta-propeller domain-containing protein [Cellulomonas sp. SLBN-39]TQL03711.1 sporulation and spore germination protein [Cellulomonas sp. SLBN-39]
MSAARTSPHPRPRPRTGVRALVGLLAAALAGCAAIPTSGPVVEGDGEVGERDRVVVLAQGPQADAAPEEIVEGFLLAGAAEVTADFAVTREYLVPQARSEWDPLAGAVVAEDVTYEQTGEARITAEATVLGTVDAEGRYAQAPDGARESLVFELQQDGDGSWRIARAPDGLVVTARDLERQFRATSVYFLTPDHRHLVPELRWFPDRDLALATAVVRALLAGPSPWLRDAVTSEIPAGAELRPEAVTVEDGVAELSLQPAQAVQEADRGLLLAQVEASLRPLGVTGVEVSAGGVLLEGASALEAWEGGDAEVVAEGALLRLAGGTATPVEGVEPGPVTGLARSEDGATRVAVRPPGELVQIGADGVVPLLTRTALVPPSVDPEGYVWSASGVAGRPLLALAPTAEEVEVDADWLADRAVRGLRVSRDGTRVAVVSTGADGTTLDVAGVVRDETGAPVRLGPPVRAGAPLDPSGPVVWVDDVTLAVLTQGDVGAPSLVTVGGPSTALPVVADAVALAAGRGERSLLVLTADGDLLRYDGRTWVRVPGVGPVTAAAYPG